MVRRSDFIYDRLSTGIASGEFPVGKRLPSEVALAGDLGVSRTAVREAISRLAAEGTVVSRHGSGTFVSRIEAMHRLDFTPLKNVDDLLRWQEFRIGMEAENASLAAQRAGAADIARLRELHTALEAIPERNEVTSQLDFEFHLTIAKATGNAVIVQIAGSLNEHVRSWTVARTLTQNTTYGERNALRSREHLAIIDAIERFDPVAASLAARRHLENGRTRLLAALSAQTNSSPA